MSSSVTSRTGNLFSRLALSLSTIGLLTGTLFFAASFTPSLIPRDYLLQGVLAGLAFGVGYLLGVLGVWLWTYLELPMLEGQAARRTKQIAGIVCAAIAVTFCGRPLNGRIRSACFWTCRPWTASIHSASG